jgi:hypothetical protein
MDSVLVNKPDLSFFDTKKSPPLKEKDFIYYSGRSNEKASPSFA